MTRKIRKLAELVTLAYAGIAFKHNQVDALWIEKPL